MLITEGRTHWLGIENIFYNTRTNRISDTIHEIIEDADLEFHPEGLRNYLEYGYSVFGQSPLKNIHILPANHKIFLQNGRIWIEKLPDPFENLLGCASSPEAVLELIRVRINQWAGESGQKIIIPLSAGFDSRLIASMIDKKYSMQAYTYGVSGNQAASIETVYAKELGRMLKIPWKQIELGGFLEYLGQWDRLYGPLTHAHGMYQMEFYDRIAGLEPPESRVISGIYGDLWAGNWQFDEVDRPEELIKLAITHGVAVDPSCCLLKESHELRDSFFEENRHRLKEQEWRILLAARMKIPLLSYLLNVPKAYGFDAWSPFLEMDIVSAMLNLSWQEKQKRHWQVDYFRSQDLLIGEKRLKCDPENCLDEVTVRKHSVLQLDAKLLNSLFDKTFLELVNRKLEEKGKDLLEYYNIYTVLYPLQRLLERKQ